MPKISVIIPIYNVEKYLCRCIDSILAQTFTDFELILVDDGSPDHCPEICDEYAARDSRIHVIHKRNEGVSIARNTGLDIVSGEYVTFVDSDDYIAPDRLELLFLQVAEHQADVVVTNYVVVDDNYQVLNKIVHKQTGMVDTETPDKIVKYINNLFLGSHGWEVWSRLFRRSIIADNNIRFPTTCADYAEDLGFILAYALHAKCVVSLEYSGYFYRIRQDSMMRTSESAVKLDQLNEVSKWVYPRYCAALGGEDEFPILHFLLLNTEYGKIRKNTERYSKLGDYLKTIQNQNWYVRQTAKIRKCKKDLDLLVGKRARQQIGLFSHYCIHRNWKRYTYECAIAYRWLIVRE